VLAWRDDVALQIERFECEQLLNNLDKLWDELKLNTRFFAEKKHYTCCRKRIEKCSEIKRLQDANDYFTTNALLEGTPVRLFQRVCEEFSLKPDLTLWDRGRPWVELYVAVGPKTYEYLWIVLVGLGINVLTTSMLDSDSTRVNWILISGFSFLISGLFCLIVSKSMEVYGATARARLAERKGGDLGQMEVEVALEYGRGRNLWDLFSILGTFIAFVLAVFFMNLAPRSPDRNPPPAPAAPVAPPPRPPSVGGARSVSPGATGSTGTSVNAAPQIPMGPQALDTGQWTREQRVAVASKKKATKKSAPKHKPSGKPR
jgi:hypothetical protein